MNRKKGRPPGKVYPQPDNIFEGIWNARWGKIGTSETMQIAMFCPYRLTVPRKLAPREEESLKQKACGAISTRSAHQNDAAKVIRGGANPSRSAPKPANRNSLD